MSDVDERKNLHAQLKAELFKRQLSNSENFDKSVLSYSTAALGFSIGFLKDFVPVTKATYAWLLYGSWTAFVVSVVVTISSFLVSQKGISRQLKINESYYLERKDEALRDTNCWARATDALNLLSGIAFVLGVVCTTVFVALNLERAAVMAEDKKVPLREGAQVPQVQKVPQADVQRGAPVPGVQQVPQQQQPQQGTGTGSTSGSGTSSGSGSNSGTSSGSNTGTGMSGGSK